MQDWWIKVVFAGTGQVIEEGHHLSFATIAEISNQVRKRGHSVLIGSDTSGQSTISVGVGAAHIDAKKQTRSA